MDIEELKDLYKDSTSIIDIAKKLNISYVDAKKKEYEVINKLYSESNSVSEVATKLGLSYYNARKIMLNHGLRYSRGHAIKASSKPEYKELSKKISDMYLNEKRSLRSIGKEVRLSHQTVFNRLKELGIELRKKDQNKDNM